MSGARLFGKLPAHGDFVARGVAAAEREALDLWLSGEMVTARALLGDAFDDRYGRVPPWRFAGSGEAGVLIASVDKVGRRYPLYLGVEGGENAAEQCEELVYRAFSEGWDADRLAGDAAAIPSAEGEAGPPRWWTLGGEGFGAAFREGERPEGLLATMLMTTEDA